MNTKFTAAAQAIADHFKATEAKRGEPFRDTFTNPMCNDAVTPNFVGIPLALLRALVEAQNPETFLADGVNSTGHGQKAGLGETVDVTVRSAGGTYLTNTVRGQKASCTAGEKQAAQRLGEKLYGASLVSVEPLPRGNDHGVTRWRLHAARTEGGAA